MKLDAAGVALIITALGGSIGAFVNAYLLLKQNRVHDKDRAASIAAREAQNAKLDEVHSLVQQVAAPDSK